MSFKPKDTFLASFFWVRFWRGVCFLSDGVGLAFGF